jgi:hypothetical protein
MTMKSWPEEIITLASALPPTERRSFFELVAERVAVYPPLSRGPGLVYRLAVEAQREFLKSVEVARGKYTRQDRNRQPH